MFNSSLPFPGPSADDFLWRLFLSYFFPLVLRMPPDTELNKKIRTDGKKPANTKVYLISKNKKVINESGKFRNFTLPYQQPADYTVANFFQFCSCEECSLNNFQFMCSTVSVFFFFVGAVESQYVMNLNKAIKEAYGSYVMMDVCKMMRKDFFELVLVKRCWNVINESIPSTHWYGNCIANK